MIVGAISCRPPSNSTIATIGLYESRGALMRCILAVPNVCYSRLASSVRSAALSTPGIELNRVLDRADNSLHDPTARHLYGYGAGCAKGRHCLKLAR